MSATMKFWQATAFLDTRRMVDVARWSEDAGFHGVMVSDHILYPEKLSSPYPYRPDGRPPFDEHTPWPDTWVTVGAMAAVTERLQFSTNVYVPGARNLFVVAKSVSTAAVISGGRVSLGVGAGWMREEFDLLGERFERRGARLDEMLGILRRLWAGGFVEHHGEFYDFDRVAIAPVPETPIPIYVGGESDAALRRAARHDGWIGGVYTPDDAFDLVGRIHDELRAAGRDPGSGFELVLAVYALDDLDLFRRLADAGVTALCTAPWMLVEAAPSAQRDAIARFGDTVISKLA